MFVIRLELVSLLGRLYCRYNLLFAVIMTLRFEHKFSRAALLFNCHTTFDYCQHESVISVYLHNFNCFKY
nr:MAG TPA: hypothetical protein [Caudoviricetes sp.]